MPQTSLRFRHVDESVHETLKPDLASELSSWLEKVGWKLKRGNMECVPHAKGHVCSGPPSSLWMIATEIQPRDRSIIQCVQQPFVLKEKDHNPGVTVLTNFFPSLLSVEQAPQRFAHPKDRWSIKFLVPLSRAEHDKLWLEPETHFNSHSEITGY